MRSKQKILLAVAVAFILLCIAGLTTPRIGRSKMAEEASRLARPSVALREVQDTASNLSLFAAGPNLEKKLIHSFAAGPNLERKLIHNADLGLVVSDVRNAAAQIRQLTESSNGQIDKVELTDTGGGFSSATLVVRVPSSGLETALAEFKKLAVRTEREQVTGRDVTQEFYDNEAHMRNLRAEEQQYLAIMKQAHTVKDTLEVSQQLSDVRDRIERLQAQIQLMTHDIDMSVVTITLVEVSDARMLGIRWQPLHNAKTAVRQLLAGLGDWVDWVIAVLIQLPLIVLWVATVGAIVWFLWKIVRKIWLRFLKPGTPTMTPQMRPTL